MSSSEDKPGKPDSGVSRRSFLKGTGLVISVPIVGGIAVVNVDGADVKVYGPGKVPVSLNINGAVKTANVEPRTTLLDTLRNELDLTGAKRVCDRGTCGACTVHVDGKAAYSCSLLAIDAQGRKITTVESLDSQRKASPGAAGICRQRCSAVRVLHAGLCHGLQGIPGQESESDTRTGSTRTGWQSLSLRNLRRHSGCGGAGCGPAIDPERRYGAMAEYKWPDAQKRVHIGKRISRIDGPDKVSGKAKYTFDINRPGMLFGKIVRSPYAHAKIVSIDINDSSRRCEA